MSHAVVIVAVSKEQFAAAGSAVEQAVAYQMAPFDEDGYWGADGSRWDWWVIGGRWDGYFPGEQNVVMRSDLTDEALMDGAEQDARKTWADYVKERARDPKMASFLFRGITPEETEDSYIAKRMNRKLSAYAFLKDRQWHEKERMGMFASRIATECEIKAEEQGMAYVGRCIYENAEQDSKIISWTGPKDSADTWGDRYWDRFVRRLPGDTTLVAVDFHV